MANIVKENSYMEFPLQIKRQYAAPIDYNEVWYDLEALKEYAKSGATAYAGQTVKYIDEAKGNAITVYTIAADGTLVTSGVNDGNIEQWNDTYRKAETDERIKTAKDEVISKIDELEKGRVWKPSVDTFDKIAETYPEPQDTWCVIAKDTNIMWMYDAEKQQWIDLGHSVIHENATQDKDGLMSKEDKKKVDGIDTAIQSAKDELDGKITALTQKHTQDKEALDKTISAMDTAYKAEDVKIRTEFAEADTALKGELTTSYTEAISAAKTEITDAYTKADTALEGKITEAYKAADKVIDDKVVAMDTAYKAADTKINESITAMDTAYKQADTEIRSAFAEADTAIRGEFAAADKVIDGKVTALTETHTNDKAELESKIQAVDAKFVAASDEQINALFA